MNAYDIEYLNILNNLDEYDFSHPYEKIPNKIVKMNEYASNVENIFPVRCSCGTLMQKYYKKYEKFSKEYKSREEIFNQIKKEVAIERYMSDYFYKSYIKKDKLSHIEASEKIKKLSKDKLVKLFYSKLEKGEIPQEILDRIETDSKYVIKMCCGNSLLSPVPIENLEASTVAISSGEIKSQKIRNIKETIAKQIAKRMKKNESDIDIEKNYVDMYGVNFSNYTPLERQELLEMARDIAFN